MYKEYRAYDKVTKRDLILHKLQSDDTYIERVRDIKHAFIHAVFDVVKMEEDNKLMVFFEPGPQASLEEALHKSRYIT